MPVLVNISVIMCGIAGVIDPSPSFNEDRSLPARMSRSLKHRGPDDQGLLTLSRERLHCTDLLDSEWRGEGLFLLHRRLSILELSKAGWQPMSSSDGRLHIVYNGEVYNFKELRLQLEGMGEIFRGASDTEVILSAYKKWGVSSFSKFQGMFALCIFDSSEKTLTLARDPFGIKPLFYSHHNGRFAFASEIPALLECSWIAREADPQAIYEYVRYGLSGHQTNSMIRHVSSLAPGHFVQIDLSAKAVHSPTAFWQLKLGPTLDLSFGEAKEKLKDLFLESVQLHLRSDVPIGAALSGGVDSSAIVSVMRHLEPNLDINTFSFVAPDGLINEERYVDIVAKKFGVRSFKVKPESHEIASDLSDIIVAQGEPFPSTSIYAQYRVFKLAKENGMKVLLDGQGADEYLAGYRFYISARLASLIRQGHYSKATHFAHQASLLPGMNFLGLALRAGDFFVPPRLQNLARRAVGRSPYPSWLNQRWLQDNQVQSRPLFFTSERETLRHTLARTLVESSLPPLLRYEDRNSMAFSIESRVPFLTTKLVEFCLHLPEEFILSDEAQPKHIFREAMRDIVPNEILDRTDKIGFQTPESRWLKEMSPWISSQLEASSLERLPILNSKVVRSNWLSVANGQSAFHDYIWRWVSLSAWAKTFQIKFSLKREP